MRSILLLTALLINSISFAKEYNPKMDKDTTSNSSDTTKIFVLERDDKRIYINEGRQVCVKVDYNKYKGALKILNDSTIFVGETSMSISEIDMITNRKTGKTIGLIFASLPIHFAGFVLAAVGYDTPIIAATGWAVISSGAVTAVILEAKRGKRYHAYSLGFNNGTINRKWNYSIQ